MYRPPRPRVTAAGQRGIRKEAGGWPSSIPQFAQSMKDPVDAAGIGLMRHPVVPPSGHDGRMGKDLLSHEHLIIDSVGSGSYFTDLLVNAVKESQDISNEVTTPVAAKGS